MYNLTSLRHGEQQKSPLLTLVDDFTEPELDQPLGLESPIQVLHRMISHQQSGKLCISDPHDPSVLWQVFVGNGQIHFATSLVGQSERLSYFLYKAGILLQNSELKVSDYQFLCSQWQAGRLTLAQLRAVLISITQDALIQVLKLPQARIRIDRHLGLDPLLISLPIVKLLSPVLGELRQWQTALPEVLSPLQRPKIANLSHWHQMLRAPRQSLPRLYLIQHFLEHHFCLYQIAQEMGVDLIQIIPLFQTLVRRNLITMHPYLRPTQPTKLRVACIDASLELQASLKTALLPEKYEVMSLTEPDTVWSTLIKFRPQMLLLDVDYFDGYSFMKALLRTEPFKAVPIVTLTEHKRLVNRLWARRAGAVDCLGKPLEPRLLMPLVQQAAVMVSQ